MSNGQFTQPDDLIAIWRHYVDVLLSPADGEDDPASKALVADEQAMRMITLTCPMTFLTEYRVYDIRSLERLVDSAEARKAGTGQETAYILLRPTPYSQDNLAKLLQRDIFAKYNIMFTNRTDDATLVAVATQDTHGSGGGAKIATLRDAFADYVPLDRHLFLACSPFATAAAPTAPPPAAAPLGQWKRPLADAVTAVAAALRCSPIIRYQRGSQRAAELAKAADDIVTGGGQGGAKRVYEFNKRCVVLVLDRCGDAVTPLLTPWTYEAMLHGLLPGGIADNTVSVPDQHGQVQRFAVGPAADAFFAEHASHDYGVMGTALSSAARSQLAAVEGLKGDMAPGDAAAAGSMSVAQMRSKLDQSAQSSTAKGLLARHMRMFEMVTDAVNREGLLETGLSEQAIASGNEGAAASISAVRSAADVAAAGGASAGAVQRLALLTALRHEDRAGDVAAAATAGGGAGGAATLTAAAVAFGGARQREEDLFGGGLLGNMKRMMGAASEEMSAYMQHVPLLKQQLELCADGKLDAKKYPVVGQAGEEALAACRRPATHIVVVVIGGATYTESDVVRRFNAARRRAERRCTALLGSTTMLTASTFVEMLRQQADSVHSGVQ
eukprot:jgi/Ulvmu1/3668/UM017_0082.1